MRITMLVLLTLALTASERPDVLMIIVDDLRDWTGDAGTQPQGVRPQHDVPGPFPRPPRWA
jgi:hypothetical protein